MTGVLIREEIKPHRRKCCETVQANVRVVQLQGTERPLPGAFSGSTALLILSFLLFQNCNKVNFSLFKAILFLGQLQEANTPFGARNWGVINK